MSNDTPRPERVTLSDEEREALLPAVCTLGKAEQAAYAHEHRHEARMTRLVPAVERILAAREQALREEIARQIGDDLEAAPVSTEGIGWYRANRRAARIARGETR